MREGDTNQTVTVSFSRKKRSSCMLVFPSCHTNTERVFFVAKKNIPSLSVPSSPASNTELSHSDPSQLTNGGGGRRRRRRRLRPGVCLKQQQKLIRRKDEAGYFASLRRRKGGMKAQQAYLYALTYVPTASMCCDPSILRPLYNVVWREKLLFDQDQSNVSEHLPLPFGIFHFKL